MNTYTEILKIKENSVFDEWVGKKEKNKNLSKWAGTVLFIIGSYLVSVFPELGASPYPFVLFFIGHVLWAGAGIQMRDEALIALNLLYIPMDVYAIFIRFNGFF